MALYDKVIFEGNALIDIIPQKPPMVMIDKLIFVDELSAVTSLFIREDNIMCHNGFFTEAGIIENIAQTAAAKSGYNRTVLRRPVITGFIGQIKDLKIEQLPPINTEIITTISRINEVFDITIIGGKVTSGDKLIAECEMKVFQPK
jgi:predicted hotdog family 3-hydroxylacyl-ACP dehydratase